MTIQNETVKLMKLQMQFNLLHDFVSGLANEGFTDASEVMKQIESIDAEALTKNMNAHLQILIRLIDEQDDAWGESEFSSAACEQALDDLGILRVYIKALLDERVTEINCPSCSSIGKMDPICETCGGSGNLPILRSSGVPVEVTPVPEGSDDSRLRGRKFRFPFSYTPTMRWCK